MIQPGKEDNMNKEYRVDTFNGSNHKKTYFDTEDSARAYGHDKVKRGFITFLLKEIIPNIYDVIEEIR